MKNNWIKTLCFVSLLIVLLSFTGCKAKPYSFFKSMDEIQSVEIVSAKSSLDFTVKKTLSEAEKNDFIDQFKTIGFHTYYIGDPMSVYGNAVKITYQNGDYEMICSCWSEYVQNGKIEFVWKNCDEEKFDKLLNEFLLSEGDNVSGGGVKLPKK